MSFRNLRIYDGHHFVWNLWHSDAPRESNLSAPTQVLITDSAPCQSALGSSCRICFKVPGTFWYVVAIFHLTAAKFAWRESGLLHIDRYRGLQDPTFFHAASAMNYPYL